ncbi:MAG TPA: hypothetical protein VKC57_00440, partial [Ktedonobacterales bacterium]|nr:hypothetical protein [Ktedonobacterales bacterium]
GTALRPDEGPWLEALLGFAQVDGEGRPAALPSEEKEVGVPEGEDWQRLAERLRKLLRLR